MASESPMTPPPRPNLQHMISPTDINKRVSGPCGVIASARCDLILQVAFPANLLMMENDGGCVLYIVTLGSRYYLGLQEPHHH